MPNHVVNEIIFEGLKAGQAADLLAGLCDAEQNADFSILLPPPLNSWPGSVGTKHEKAFPTNHLDWCRQNWGTKWGAYSSKPTEITETTLILRFQTAWSPPRGWLLAIFNRFKLSFRYNWLDEGESRGHAGYFDYPALDDLTFRKEAWGEQEADDALDRHLHMLRWGDAADEIMAERDAS